MVIANKDYGRDVFYVPNQGFVQGAVQAPAPSVLQEVDVPQPSDNHFYNPALDGSNALQEGYIDDEPQRQARPKYEPDFDQIESYGGIIRDLTDTKDFLADFELRLLGLKRNSDDSIVKDNSRKIYVDPDSIHEFIDMLRSIVNQNTHFSNFREDRVLNTLNAANYYINRWLMLQGDKIPRKIRAKISFESMNLIQGSLYKANDATILKWTKGSFREGMNMTDKGRSGGGGFFDWILGKKNKPAVSY